MDKRDGRCRWVWQMQVASLDDDGMDELGYGAGTGCSIAQHSTAGDYDKASEGKIGRIGGIDLVLRPVSPTHEDAVASGLTRVRGVIGRAAPSIALGGVGC